MEKMKKRGRKPKGGKIIENQIQTINENEKEETNFAVVQNIILHLRCFRKDIEDTTAAVVEPYSHETSFECMTVEVENIELTLHQKLKQLADNLRKNEVNKKADCFWCTCPYSTPPVYIPKGRVNGQYDVYGSFCCPECAAAYVFNENTLDDSVKFDRYHMLNYMYGKSNNYTKNILPAPSPYYLLDKYYGNMSVDEYRKLIQNDQQLILIVDKPICVVCPELVQSNRNYIEKIGVEGGYRLCRKKKMESS
jgi:hypothetical protein